MSALSVSMYSYNCGGHTYFLVEVWMRRHAPSSQLQPSSTYAAMAQEIGFDCHLTSDLQTITAACGCFNLPKDLICWERYLQALSWCSFSYASGCAHILVVFTKVVGAKHYLQVAHVISVTCAVSQHSMGSILMVQLPQPVQNCRAFTQGQWGWILLLLFSMGNCIMSLH